MGVKEDQREPEVQPKLPATVLAEIAPEEPFNIETVLASERFALIVMKFPNILHTYVVGFALLYLQFHPDGFKFWESLSSLHEENVYPMAEGKDLAIIQATLLEKLGVNGTEDFGTRSSVYEYLVRTVVEDGFVYHGFNGAFEADILSHGLSTEKRAWDTKELQEVHDMLYRAEPVWHLGFSQADKKMVYYSYVPRHIYRYAIHSPDWFAYFISDEWNSPIGYDQAKENVTRKVERLSAPELSRGLSLEEKIKVLNFFERNWKIFRGVNAKPKVALIPRKIVDPDLDVKVRQYKKEASLDILSSETSVKGIIEKVIATFMSEKFGTHYETIPPDQIKIVNLPVI